MDRMDRITMPKLSREISAFAATMSERQWRTLGSLAIGPYFLSATERGDPELYALVRHKLAQCFVFNEVTNGLWGWRATDLGKTLVRQRYGKSAL